MLNIVIMEQRFDREKFVELLSGDLMKQDPSVVIQSLVGIIFALLDENEALRKQNAILMRRVEELEKENRLLKEEVRELKIRLGRDSHNSSKPPSSDGLKKPPVVSLRKSSGKRPGGQPGHRGRTMEMSDNPDRIVEHVIEECTICGKHLGDVPPEKIHRRQVFDIPSLQIEVTEHRVGVKTCPCCGAKNSARFPLEAPAILQYGPGIKSLVTVLMSYQFIPYKRLSEFFRDTFGQSISPGTFNNIMCKCYEILEDFETIVKKDISNSRVACFDETGLRSEGKLHWLHSASTGSLTHYHIDEKRGAAGMRSAGILPEFSGTAVHDGWQQYFGFSCRHALCNAHHLRELTSAEEQEGMKWASRMIEFLLDSKSLVDSSKNEGKKSLEAFEIETLEKRYEEILKGGYDEYPSMEIARPKKRGREKKAPSLNLLERLWDNMKCTLAFMYDFQVPFDNNLSERDIRMMKVKQKISGSFRSDEGAEWFCRIRSYISTIRKNGLNVLQSVKDAFSGKPFIPKIAFEGE